MLYGSGIYTNTVVGVCPVVKLPISSVNLTKSGTIGDKAVWSVSPKPNT